ncbi:hypothetical protein HanRHA438_Chr08g0360031 [Helianthus annuus]|nr:hypothetical protein HanRHA438_Chr08g0360031 [Helianthus annuus]
MEAPARHLLTDRRPPVSGRTPGQMQKRADIVNRPGKASEPLPDRSGRPVRSGSENVACNSGRGAG